MMTISKIRWLEPRFSTGISLHDPTKEPREVKIVSINDDKSKDFYNKAWDKCMKQHKNAHRKIKN